MKGEEKKVGSITKKLYNKDYCSIKHQTGNRESCEGEISQSYEEKMKKKIASK
jgi:hypothetical protein